MKIKKYQIKCRNKIVVFYDLPSHKEKFGYYEGYSIGTYADNDGLDYLSAESDQPEISEIFFTKKDAVEIAAHYSIHNIDDPNNIYTPIISDRNYIVYFEINKYKYYLSIYNKYSCYDDRYNITLTSFKDYALRIKEKDIYEVVKNIQESYISILPGKDKTVRELGLEAKYHKLYEILQCLE